MLREKQKARTIQAAALILIYWGAYPAHSEESLPR
jgi:hypothetical protein